MNRLLLPILLACDVAKTTVLVRLLLIVGPWGPRSIPHSHSRTQLHIVQVETDVCALKPSFWMKGVVEQVEVVIHILCGHQPPGLIRRVHQVQRPQARRQPTLRLQPLPIYQRPILPVHPHSSQHVHLLMHLQRTQQMIRRVSPQRNPHRSLPTTQPQLSVLQTWTVSQLHVKPTAMGTLISMATAIGLRA